MDILNAIINSEVSTDEILEWLTTDNPQSAPFLDIVQTDLTRTEFIIYFLDYVRKQCQGILHVGANDIVEGQPRKNDCSTPSKESKKIPEKPHEKFNNDNVGHSPKFQSHNNVKLQTLNNSFEEKFADISIAGQSIESGLTSTPLKSMVANKTFPDGRSPLHPTRYSGTPGVLFLSRNNSAMSEGNFNVLNQSLHSSPISTHGNAQLINFNQTQNSTNFFNSLNSFPELTNSSQQMRNISMNDSIISNSSMTSSMTPCSPISPLYTANIQPMYNDKINILTPKRESTGKNLKNKYSPVQNQNSSHKKKTTPAADHNRSLCLGDFLTVDMSKSKKNVKKDKSFELKNKNDGDENSSMNESSNKNVNKPRSRRRIKPTQLNASNNSENQQQQVFGIVNRPSIVNPQFAEASPKDKPNETASFEVERELLKLERQRPKLKVEVVENNGQEPAACQNRPKPSAINIVPKLELVENIKVLNILASLYSGLLSKNLVPNLMTELYFIISLITFHYKSHNEEEEEKSQKNVKECKSDDSIFQDSLEQLKINLGCKDINEDAPENTKNFYESQKSFGELLDSSLNGLNDTKEEENLKENLKTVPEQILYFKTAHNCVYFAITILTNEKKLLVVLDRATLKLLSDNHLVISFQPELQKYLNQLYGDKCLQSKQIKPYSSVLQTNVCFEIDTDNRENFPSGQAFSTFRKQRDLFYEILKIWEDSHLRPNWSFCATLERKINTMLSMHHDTVNYYHIARLFKSQLLVSSIEHKQPEQPVNDESLSILKNMKHLDPDKLMQLKERLVTPVTSTSMGPVPPPSFPDVQEFYRDFLLVSSNPKFHTILEHCFIQEIMELNETHFVCIDVDNKESSVDESTKQSYLLSISSLRLMAKFLGLLVSMPYQSEINSVDVINTQIALRSRIRPPLDLQECLCDALKHGKLSLTIPWMVQYLAMLDSISFRLPYYLKLCEILYCIYRVVQDSVNHKTALLITFSIGWLFELPNFPKDLYYNWCTNYDSKKIQITSKTVDKVKKNKSMSQLMIEDSKSSFKEQNLILDKMEIIDDRALNACCPFLKVFKVLLTSGNSNLSSNSNANRHITPVSSQLSQPSSATKAMILQLQLQEAFFHGQPKSVKKTVDFISERIASSCVKYICRSVIPKYEDEYCKAWKKFLKHSRGENEEFTAREKMAHISVVDKQIKEQCKEVITQMTKTRTTNAIESLLAEDVLPVVKHTCIRIAQRMAMERINQWIDSYINNMITSNNMNERCMKNKTQNENSEEEAEDVVESKKSSKIHNPQAPCSTFVIKELRNSLWELIEQHGRWSLLTEEQTLINIQSLKATLLEREDTVPPVEKVLYMMSVDYALHIIVFKKELMTTTVENNFIEVWKTCPNVEDYFASLLSPRNVKILTQTYDKTVWPKYGKFIGRLLMEKILSWDQFSEQCIAILRVEWPIDVLKLFPTCLMETLSCFKSTNEHMEKIKYLIEWTAEACTDLNNPL